MRKRMCEKDYDKLDKLKEENKKLKRQISTLRKQIDRLDLDNSKYDHIRELAAQQYEEEKNTSKAKKLREKWKCYECGSGVLKLIIIPSPGGLKYFRSCNNCDNRTKAKQYNKDVEGIK